MASSPAREAGPGHSDTPSSVISNTMPGDNQGNQQNVIGDHTMPILNFGGHVNMTFYSCLWEKSKSSENWRGRIRILVRRAPPQHPQIWDQLGDDVSAKRSCTRGGRKIFMESEYSLTKDVFQVYDEAGTWSWTSLAGIKWRCETFQTHLIIHDKWLEYRGVDIVSLDNFVMSLNICRMTNARKTRISRGE